MLFWTTEFPNHPSLLIFTNKFVLLDILYEQSLGKSLRSKLMVKYRKEKIGFCSSSQSGLINELSGKSIFINLKKESIHQKEQEFFCHK